MTLNDVYLFFVGQGVGSIAGVPARNLSYEEAKNHGITHLLASGLYVYNSEHAIPEEWKEDLGLPSVEDEPVKKSKKRNKKESE